MTELEKLNAECERAWAAYRIAHNQAMSNGEAAANARAEVEALLERVAVLEGNWAALERIISEVYVETDQPDRVRWDGVWYDGPLATAYVRTMKVLQKLAHASLTQGGE